LDSEQLFAKVSALSDPGAAKAQVEALTAQVRALEAHVRVSIEERGGLQRQVDALQEQQELVEAVRTQQEELVRGVRGLQELLVQAARLQEAISEAPPAGAPGPTAPPQGGADFESLAPHVGELAQTATRLIGLEGRVAAALESLASAGRVEDFEPRMQEVSQQLEAIVPRVEELSRRTESLGELQAIAPRVSELAQSVARLTGAGGVEARLADAREAIDAQRGLAPRVAELARNLANVASCGPRAAELLRRLEDLPADGPAAGPAGAGGEIALDGGGAVPAPASEVAERVAGLWELVPRLGTAAECMGEVVLHMRDHEICIERVWHRQEELSAAVARLEARAAA